jgi:hypothetical protein
MGPWHTAAMAVLLVAQPRPASAAWSFMAFLGGSHTAPATLTLDQPATAIHVVFSRVPLDSRSLSSPPYYGYRLAWFPARGGAAGIEAELIHLKVFARTATMEPLVDRFSISHGLNLLVANFVWRQPGDARRLRLVARAGAGVAIPHAESRVGGVDQEQYEFSSAAFQAAAGPEFRLAEHARAFVEYKLTTTAPSVGVAGGTIHGRYTSQHVATGLGVEW